MAAAAAPVAHPAEHILRPSEQELIHAWRELVRANAAQVARLQEFNEPADYWADGFAGAEVDLNKPETSRQIIAGFAEPGDQWLDVGAGFGRITIPLSLHVERITALDPSPGITQMLVDQMDRLGIENIDVLDPTPWPPKQSLCKHDICIAINVINFVEDIGPFLNAMEDHAARLCIVGATELGTAWQPIEPLFEAVHGERFIRLPALRDFLNLLGARRRRFDIQTYSDMPAAMRDPQDLDEAHQRVRRHYLVREGSEKDRRLRELMSKHFGLNNNRVQLPPPIGNFAAVVSWEPPSDKVS